MVAPHGSCEAIFGTNPIAIGVPHAPRHLIVDMATSADAWFSLVSAAAEGRSIRDDIAYDAEGDRLFVTGKLWPSVFEIRVTEP